MKCPSCQSYVSLGSDFCLSCGAQQRGSRLPVKRVDAAPALWRQAAPALARGAALVLVGIAAEWLLRSVAKRALGGSSMDIRPGHRTRGVAADKRRALPEDVLALSETVIMRRTILRR